MAPFYPLAFVVIAYAYLARHAPPDKAARCQCLCNRWCRPAALIGFASTVFGAVVPWTLSLQYLAMATAFGSGLYVIRRG